VSLLVDVEEGRTWKHPIDHLKIRDFPDPVAESVQEKILEDVVPEPTLMEPNIVAPPPVTSDRIEVPAHEKQTVPATVSDSPKPTTVSTPARTHSPVQPSTTQLCSRSSIRRSTRSHNLPDYLKF